MLFTGLSSVMILKLPESYGSRIFECRTSTTKWQTTNIRSANGQFAKIDYQPNGLKRFLYVSI
jgi:hypothetical protein